MPFFRCQDEDWQPTVDVGLCQLGGSGSKPLFRILTSFGYVPTGVYDPVAREPDPAPDRLVYADDETDLASVPPFLWGVIASYGNHTMPALLHDRLCNEARTRDLGSRLRERREADSVFRVMLRNEARMGIVTRWIMWAAVRLFGVIAIGAGVVLVCAVAAIYLLTSGRVAAIAGGVALALGVALIAAMLWYSVEKDETGTRSLRPAAVAEWLAAGVIGALAVGPLLPVIAVTLVTRAALWLADLVVLALHFVVVRIPVWVWQNLRYPTIGPPRRTSPGDTATRRPATRPKRTPEVAREPVPTFGRIFPRM